MSRKRSGGYLFNQELARIRNATTTIQDLLNIIFEGKAGPNSIIAIAGQIARQNMIILDANQKLKAIGQEAKKERTE